MQSCLLTQELKIWSVSINTIIQYFQLKLLDYSFLFKYKYHGRQRNLEELKTGQKTGVQDRSIAFLTWREQRQFGDAAYVYACRLVYKCLSL